MSLKKGANFPITAENKTGRAFKQVHSDMNRMSTVAHNLIDPLADPTASLHEGKIV